MIGKSISTAALLGLGPVGVSAASSGYKTVYKPFTQAEPSELKPSSSSSKLFGRNVAVSNGLIAVSSNEVVIDYDSSGQLSKRGRVSVFGPDYLRRYTNTGVDFTSSSVNDGYGSSLALWSGTMLVGAPTDSSGGDNAGKAYIYFGSNLGSVQALTAEHAEEGDYFGYSVAIVHGQSYYSSGMAVVGAYGHDHDRESTSGQGCVFVYALDSSSVWNVVGKLEPQDFEHKDHGGFGYSLSAYGNTVAVGTYSTDSAYVFELGGHMHECPHGHEGDMPAECGYRRHLRSLQGPPEEDNKKWYTAWDYEHILTVGVQEEHKPEKEKEANSYSFGHSVALYNESGILTLAVGAPDAVGDDDTHVGRVYVMSVMNRGDVRGGWFPEGYDHHDEDKQQEEAEREQREQEEQERKEQEEQDRQDREEDEKDRDERDEGEDRDRQDREGDREGREGEGDKKRSLQGEGDKNRFRTWNVDENSYCGDKMGNFWVVEAVMEGSVSSERFGHSLDISANTLLIGNNPSTFQAGRAALFSRQSGMNDFEESPLVSGPLFYTNWGYTGILQDSKGMNGDHFGYSVAFDNDVAVVGAIMPDIQASGTFGQGVAYVYDKVSMVNTAPTAAPTPTPGVGGDTESLYEQLSDTHSVMGISFLSASSIVGCAFTLAGCYALYVVAGGKSSPRQLLGLSSSGPTTTNKQIRLASMDDSGYSGSSSSQRGLKSAYTGLDTSSSHGQSRLPGRPSSSKIGAPVTGKSGSGSSRSFTPQAQRSFTPKTARGGL